jgi:hypothetical protein
VLGGDDGTIRKLLQGLLLTSKKMVRRGILLCELFGVVVSVVLVLRANSPKRYLYLHPAAPPWIVRNAEHSARQELEERTPSVQA